MKKFKRLFGYSMLIGTTGLIAGKLPSGAKVPVQSIATAGSAFVSPLASVTGAAITLEQLKKLNLKKRRRKNAMR